MAGIESAHALPVDYKLGEYTILSVLGHGGFGITYLARDTRLGSLVAVKEYFPRAFATREAGATIRPHTGTHVTDAENYHWGLQEFLKEAQALARFKHNHIVRVLRFLEANGTAYMVMEYEEGESLTSYLRKHRGFLSEPVLLGVFLPVLNGLQAVHDAGLLHLDIKPDNIYLRAGGQPLLIDFGCARQVRSGATASGKVALSRGYCALEQYPNHGERGPWTDVYSMGATLYRCITGKEPVDALVRHTTIARGKIDPLPPAAKLERPLYAPHIRECADRTMRLKPEERPPSAYALQNGLMGKEMKAERRAPVVPFGRGSGFIGIARTVMSKRRRKVVRRGALEKLFAFFLFLATALIVTPKILVDTGTITEDEVYGWLDVVKTAPHAAGRELKRFIDEQVLGARRTPTVRTGGDAPLPVRKPGVDKPPAAFDVSKKTAHTLKAHAPAVSLAFLQQGAVLATALDDGAVQLWNAETGEWQRTFSTKTKSAGVVAVAPDGHRLAMTGDEYGIRLWDVEENKSAGHLPGHADAVTALAFAPDGKVLASAGRDQALILWDMENPRRLRDLAKSRAEPLALAFSPNGRVLAVGDAAGGIQYWEMPAGKELAYSLAQNSAITALAYSPDGKWLASGGKGGFLKLWRAGLDRNDRALAGAPETVHALAFSPDGKWLIVSGDSEAVQLWNLETDEMSHRLTGHNHNVYALAVSPDGKLVASAGDDKKVRIWK
jgi:hypothetical protein